MNNQQAAICREKLNGIKAGSTGQSQAPTEVDKWDLRTSRRATNNLKWVVDFLIGDMLALDASDPSNEDTVWTRVQMVEKRQASSDRTIGFIMLMSVISTSFMTSGTLLAFLAALGWWWQQR